MRSIPSCSLSGLVASKMPSVTTISEPVRSSGMGSGLRSVHVGRTPSGWTGGSSVCIGRPTAGRTSTGPCPALDHCSTPPGLRKARKAVTNWPHSRSSASRAFTRPSRRWGSDSNSEIARTSVRACETTRAGARPWPLASATRMPSRPSASRQRSKQSPPVMLAGSVQPQHSIPGRHGGAGDQRLLGPLGQVHLVPQGDDLQRLELQPMPLHRDAGLLGDELDQRQVAGREGRVPLVDRLDDAHRLAVHAGHRRGEQVSSDETAPPVGLGVEARVLVRVGDVDDLAALERVADDAGVAGDADLLAPQGDLRPQLIRDVVVEEDARPLAVEQAGGDLGDAGQERVELGRHRQQPRDVQHQPDLLVRHVASRDRRGGAIGPSPTRGLIRRTVSAHAGFGQAGSVSAMPGGGVGTWRAAGVSSVFSMRRSGRPGRDKRRPRFTRHVRTTHVTPTGPSHCAGSRAGTTVHGPMRRGCSPA